MREQSYLISRLEIQPKEDNSPDLGQSSARYFKKIAKVTSEPAHVNMETFNYFQ